jgi:prolyl-tRNA synthetase
MIHSDNTGVVLPPRVAQVQVVIIPILFKNDDSKAIVGRAWELAKELKAAGIRVQVDDRENHNPGFKFANWEVKGTPIRLEIGTKDLEKSEVKVAIRHSGEKFQLSQEKLSE